MPNNLQSNKEMFNRHLDIAIKSDHTAFVIAVTIPGEDAPEVILNSNVV